MAGYGDDSGFQTWLTERGLLLPEDALPLAILRQRGSDYVDSLYGRCFLGTPTGGLDQERAWPRTGASAGGQPISSSAVPLAVVLASYRSALIEATTPGLLTVTARQGARVRRQKVEGIEREFFDDGATTQSVPVDSMVEGLMRNYVDHVCMGWSTDKGSLGIWAVGH